MSIFGLGDVEWHDRARCGQDTEEAKRVRDFFFSSELSEQYQARDLCYGCEVRAECLKWALDTKQIWGVWGGRTEDDIRRALSVSYTGQEIRRRRSPQCPYCGARPVHLSVYEVDQPGGGRWATAKIVQCDSCGFSWKSRTSANAVNNYHVAREAKLRKKAEEKEKLKAKKEKKKKPKAT